MLRPFENPGWLLFHFFGISWNPYKLINQPGIETSGLPRSRCSERSSCDIFNTFWNSENLLVHNDPRKWPGTPSGRTMAMFLSLVWIEVEQKGPDVQVMEYTPEN